GRRGHAGALVALAGGDDGDGGGKAAHRLFEVICKIGHGCLSSIKRQRQSPWTKCRVPQIASLRSGLRFPRLRVSARKCRSLLEKPHLRSFRRPEKVGSDRQPFPCEACTLPCLYETGADQVGPYALTAHARPEIGIIVASAAHVADDGHYLRG